MGVHQIAHQRFENTHFTFPHIQRDKLKAVIAVASLFHDFGKATPFFQEYLKNPEKSSNSNERKRRQHGLISALVTFGILQERFPENPFLAVLGFIIVRRHHGNLENYESLVTFKEGELENCIIQSNHIDYPELREIVKVTGYSEYANKGFLKEIVGFFQPRTPRSLRRLNREFNIEHYFALNLMYSILLHADKTDVILRENIVPEPEMLRCKHVHSFKIKLGNDPKNDIGVIRENAFNSVEKAVESLDSTSRILSINLPTGSGKTITSLNAALKLCEQFGHDHVVYCLPFTSVIDQNYKVFDDIRKKADLPDDSGILLKHHHLTDIHYQAVTDENSVLEYSPNEALHLIEGWESRITVTTFVQLMCSLITYKNASLRKFHRFSNAVIILDEVQSIPHHYWKLVKEILTRMVEWLDSRVILVTATMPLVFSEKAKEIKELVSNKKNIFAGLNRIELDLSNLKNSKMGWDEFCDSALNIVKGNPDKDILFVMNTIRSARELFETLTEAYIPHRLIYLSSHVIPKHRLERINLIKNRDPKIPVLVVSTQLVEAGVDIDLDIVIRDFAPLDSIFQTCGRCNRESRNGVKGKVLLYSLKDSNDWTPSGIYKNFLKQKTMKVFKEKEIIPESEFYNLANEYFNELKTGGSQTESIELLARINKLKYQNKEETIEIKLIDDSYTSSVFIEFDEKAVKAWEKYQQAMEMESGFEKNVALKQALRNLSEYIINVPQKALPNGHDTGIYYLRHGRVPEYYAQTIGFDLSAPLPPEQSSAVF